MNIQQRLNELTSNTKVTVAGVKNELPLSYLPAVFVEVEYVVIISDDQHRIRKIEMIVYNKGEVDEEAYYLRTPEVLFDREPYHSNDQVKTHIETLYPGAEVIKISQNVRAELDMIDVEAKWTDGLFYSVRYVAWGPSQFAEIKLEQA